MPRAHQDVPMKSLRPLLRLWIATTSLAGFLGGWMLLSHAPKPAPLVSQAPAMTQVSLPPLPDLPPLDGSAVRLQPLPSLQPGFGGVGRLRTRGS
jgi:hypothetical protein